MARGRMINSRICRDKRVDDLADDTSRLAFTWLISFADVEGRVNGDPALVASMLFPRRRDVSAEQMERYVQEWHDKGLIVWYEAEGDLWIWFPSFDKNQRGLDRRKEPESLIPEPPGYVPSTDERQPEPKPVAVPSTGQARAGYVPSTGQVQHKRTEQKLNRTEGEEKLSRAREVAGDSAEERYANNHDNNNNGHSAGAPPLVSEAELSEAQLMSIMDTAGVIVASHVESQKWMELLDTSRDPTLVRAAFESAAGNGKRPTPNYIEAILRRCVQENCMPDEWPNRTRGSPGEPGLLARVDAELAAYGEEEQ